MSNGLSGVTNYIHFYEQDRADRIKASKNAAIRKYIVGFGKHVYEIVRACPECKSKEMRATKSYTNETGREILLENLQMTEENLKNGLVIAKWECKSCGHREIKTVKFFDLLEDINNPELKIKQ